MLSRVRLVICWVIGLSCVAISCATSNPSDFVDVQKAVPNVVLDIRYATTNNFTGQQLYETSRCYLRRRTAEKLARAQREFNALGFGLKVFDGYRPLSVQRKMWAVYPHEGYVADPKKGSRHNRGAAVDVTLVKLGGSDLLMPTGYDDFTEKAHRNSTNAPPEAIKNRELLERIMLKNGFRGIPTEWWHFDDLQWKDYPLTDVPYEQLQASPD